MMAAWTTVPRTATWVVNPTIGDGTNSQGGVPPALAYEEEPIDEVGYTRADWLNTNVSRIPITGDTSVIGGGKFRITLNHAKFGCFDPIVMPGMRMSHLHEFFGNLGIDENSTWQSLRLNPGSNNFGAPLNSSPYWVPAMLFLDPATGLYLPIKSIFHALYYNLQDKADPAKTFRLPRGISIIGGVDPLDRFNTARLTELPSDFTQETWSGTPGASTLSGTNRLNGWQGWSLFDENGDQVPADAGSDADISPITGYPRQLVNSDGTDPWNGAGEHPDCQLVATVIQPTAWDGHNLTSPNGRDHLRYTASVDGDGAPLNVKGPDGWWRLPFVENKGFYPNSRPGISGHAFRSKLWFSSDLFDMNGDFWPEPHPNCSTPHFDLIPNWDDVVLTSATGWLQQCSGIPVDGVAGNPGECDTGTINAVNNLRYGARPAGYDDTMAPAIIGENVESATAPTKDVCGPPVLNSRIPIAVSTC